eukprot:884970-Pelagomonas_calceolata.AAC.2
MHGRSSLHGAHSAMHACMCSICEQGMVCRRKVLLLPQALHINVTFVPGRTGLADISTSLARLPSFVFELYGLLLLGHA